MDSAFVKLKVVELMEGADTFKINDDFSKEHWKLLLISFFASKIWEIMSLQNCFK